MTYGGGWNPQQDPHGGGQYGNDPYGAGGQYGAGPYDAGPYGAGQPAYGSGFGQPPPPPKRSKLPIVLSIIGIVAVVGTVVTIVLLNRADDPAPAAGPTNPPSKATSKSGTPSSARKATSAKKPPDKGSWIPIDNTKEAGLKYEVPPDWKGSEEKRRTGLGVDFTGAAVYGMYECGGSNYFRSFVASGDVQGKDGAALELNETVKDFAESFSNDYYNKPKLDIGSPKSSTVDGKKAATLTIKLTPEVAKKDCEASKAEVAILGVLLEESGKPAGVAMLVVVNDLDGGPSTPEPVSDSLAEEILGTVKVG